MTTGAGQENSAYFSMGKRACVFSGEWLISLQQAGISTSPSADVAKPDVIDTQHCTFSWPSHCGVRFNKHAVSVAFSYRRFCRKMW